MDLFCCWNSKHDKERVHHNVRNLFISWIKIEVDFTENNTHQLSSPVEIQEVRE